MCATPTPEVSRSVKTVSYTRALSTVCTRYSNKIVLLYHTLLFLDGFSINARGTRHLLTEHNSSWKLLEINLLKPDDTAIISNKPGFNRCTDDRVMSVAKSADRQTDRQTDGFSALYNRR